jgi:hypothetical protein
MKIKLNNISKKNLITEIQRKKVIKESVNNLRTYKGKKLIDETVKLYLNLLNEGYDSNEIDEILDEQDSPLSSILPSGMNFGSLLTGGGISMIKEYVIGWLLKNVLNFSDEQSKIIAVGLADVNPLDLIRVFKNEASCNEHMPHITNSIMEVILRNYGGKVIKGQDLGQQGFGMNYLGNVAGEALSQSNLGKVMASKYLCPYIEKMYMSKK